MNDAVWLRGTYENAAADCPHCAREVIFNRASDLGSFAPISGADVNCLHPDCSKGFRVIGDLVNEAYDMFFFDAGELYQRKRYSLVILSLAQAWEVFFAAFLRVKLAYKPYLLHQDLEATNADLRKLYEATSAATFERLRASFLNLILHPARAASVDEFVTDYAELTQKPGLAEMDVLPEEIKELVLVVYQTEIANLRNQVVHKNAYRPTKQEVDRYVKETGDALIPLGRLLSIHDDLNWHINEFAASQRGEQSGR